MNKILKFDGRPCPPEFRKELTDLRKRGLLDGGKLKTALVGAAKAVRSDLKQPTKQ